MSKVKVEKEVSKETYEMALALTAMVKGVKDALDDGWQLGQDLPAVVSVLVANLAQAVEGFRAAPGEWKEDPDAFVAAVSLGLAGLVGAVKS